MVYQRIIAVIIVIIIVSVAVSLAYFMFLASTASSLSRSNCFATMKYSDDDPWLHSTASRSELDNLLSSSRAVSLSIMMNSLCVTLQN